MTGEYDLIGRKGDSTATYTGHVTLRDDGEVLQVIRTVEGKTDKCVARFDTVAGSDRFPCYECIFISMGRSMTPPTADNLILITTRDLQGVFILPPPNRLAWKRFSPSTNNGKALLARNLAALDFRESLH